MIPLPPLFCLCRHLWTEHGTSQDQSCSRKACGCLGFRTDARVTGETSAPGKSAATTGGAA
jgi:hypothetical protein